MAASSSTSSPPRAPPTAFYRNPFAIDSPFKMLRQRHLSIEQHDVPAIQLHSQVQSRLHACNYLVQMLCRPDCCCVVLMSVIDVNMVVQQRALLRPGSIFKYWVHACSRSVKHARLLQEPEHADGEAHAAAGMMQGLTLCASNEGMLSEMTSACITAIRRTLGLTCSKQSPMTSSLPDLICSLPPACGSFPYWYLTLHAEYALMPALLDVQGIFQLPRPVIRHLNQSPQLRRPTRLPCWPAVLQLLRLPLQRSHRQLPPKPHPHLRIRCVACRWET
jgi:hypothetical protein